MLYDIIILNLPNFFYNITNNDYTKEYYYDLLFHRFIALWLSSYQKECDYITRYTIMSPGLLAYRPKIDKGDGC